MFAVVLVKDCDDIAAEVERLLAPHVEEYHGEERCGFWDWYRVGGRWDGIIAGVNRAKECARCQANDHDCHYSGEHEQMAHNAVPVRQMGEVRPYTIVTPDGAAHHREEWTGEEFVTDEHWDETSGRLFLANRDAIAVGVDYHS
jgi:hypothetical protein